MVTTRRKLESHRRILFLFGNKDQGEEMSRQARKRAEEFTWAAYQQRVAEVFRELL